MRLERLRTWTLTADWVGREMADWMAGRETGREWRATRKKWRTGVVLRAEEVARGVDLGVRMLATAAARRRVQARPAMARVVVVVVVAAAS